MTVAELIAQLMAQPPDAQVRLKVTSNKAAPEGTAWTQWLAHVEQATLSKRVPGDTEPVIVVLGR